MNVFARVEAACASFVETTFARVFPSDLPPEQVARKLVVTMETAPSDTYLVRVHPTDYARFSRDREYLESRWSALLADAARDAGRELDPHVVLHEDGRIVAGSVTIEAVVDESSNNHGRALALCVEGGEMRRRYRLDDGVTIGRADSNAIVLADARVSREHARIVGTGEEFAIEDRDSANGTFLNGRRIRRAPIAPGDVIAIGMTTLTVAPLDG